MVQRLISTVVIDYSDSGSHAAAVHRVGPPSLPTGGMSRQPCAGRKPRWMIRPCLCWKRAKLALNHLARNLDQVIWRLSLHSGYDVSLEVEGCEDIGPLLCTAERWNAAYPGDAGR